MADKPVEGRADALLLMIFDNLGIDFAARNATREECLGVLNTALSDTPLADACLDTYKNWTGETYVCTLERGHVAEERDHQGISDDPQYGMHRWHFRYSHNQTPTSAARHQTIIDWVVMKTVVSHYRTQYHNMCVCGAHLVPEGVVLNAGVTNNEVIYEGFMNNHIAKIAAEMAFNKAMA